MSYRSHLFSSAVAALAAIAISGPAAAAGYPNRTITVVCASGAGGAVDVTTRIIVDHMAKTLGQNMVVQNEPGAGGTISINTVSKSAPDGYTLLSIGPSVSTIKELYPNATVDAQRDLQPVSEIGFTPMVLMLHKDVPVKDYASLLAYIKANPGKLTFASNGRGSAGHLAGSLFKKMAHADLRYIPYRSTPQATADLLGGRVSMIWLSSLGNVGKSSSVHPIAVTLVGERWKMFPDVPTFDELGLKGYEIATWVSMYAPKNAPPEVAEKLTAAVKAALADPQVQARLDKAGIVRPRQVGPEVLKKKLAHEIEKWGDILRTTKDSD
ncbi:MAG: tripartite tricarboxylate transporter substrate binding protein [Rhizobiales bacterium]|jgi:tripartite-type tricarboxylate transporter receptor subunit TctC|nr:tripartite tricarboxylate transporter substrate binding protein [Hyphomicrobiales bacterium]